jgi:hypothetical protein
VCFLLCTLSLLLTQSLTPTPHSDVSRNKFDDASSMALRDLLARMGEFSRLRRLAVAASSINLVHALRACVSLRRLEVRGVRVAGSLDLIECRSSTCLTARLAQTTALRVFSPHWPRASCCLCCAAHSFVLTPPPQHHDDNALVQPRLDRPQRARLANRRGNMRKRALRASGVGA